MSNYRSHTQAQVTAAFLRGEKVWTLDTANYGEEVWALDTANYGEALAEVLHHHELEELPTDWSLNHVPTPDYVQVLVCTIYGRSIGETGGYQRHVAYLPENTSLSIPPIRVLPEIGELRYVEMIEKSADHDDGGPLDLVLAQLWTREAFIADQCEKMNGHHGAVYAAFGQS